MIISLQRYLERKTVVDYGTLVSVFGLGVITGIAICICLLLIP